MVSILEIVFFLTLLLIINTYLFYPLGLFFIKKFSRSPQVYDFHPKISILIAAYNEEKVIRQRIENIAKQDYDFSKIELIIGSDCSSDSTNEILLELEKEFPWLKVKIFKERRGKAGVLNDLIEEANNEILVFSDANTVFERDAIKKLVRHFADERIGGVCGKLVLTDENIDKKEGVEEAKYWQFETIIKEGEGRLGILIGANGGNFAIRKLLAAYLPPDKPVTDDFYLSLKVLQSGAKFIYESNSIATEDVGQSIGVEFRRKIRFAATNFQTLALLKDLLFSKNIFLTYAFWSHKVLRWFFPIFSALLLIFSLLLYPMGMFYKIVLFIQIFFYLFSLFGFILSKIKVNISLFSLSYFFLLSNIALFIGLIRFIKGRHTVIWESTKR